MWLSVYKTTTCFLARILQGWSCQLPSKNPTRPLHVSWQESYKANLAKASCLVMEGLTITFGRVVIILQRRKNGIVVWRTLPKSYLSTLVMGPVCLTSFQIMLSFFIPCKLLPLKMTISFGKTVVFYSPINHLCSRCTTTIWQCRPWLCKSVSATGCKCMSEVWIVLVLMTIWW